MNAVIHFAFALTVSRLKLAAPDLIYLLAALVLTFATIAVPVQFDGNSVTLIWSAEAAILFWIGRTKQIPLFENYSYPLMFLAVLSLLNDWQTLMRANSSTETAAAPILNWYFATAIFFVIAFALIYFINRKKKFAAANETVSKIADYAIPAVFLFALYNTFRIEIGNYYNLQILEFASQADLDTFAETNFDDPNLFNIIWQTNYTMLFLTILSFVNIEKIRSSILGFINIFLDLIALLMFLTGGLYCLSELRENYLSETMIGNLQPGEFHIVLRYISYIFAGALIFAVYRYLKQEFIEKLLSSRDSAYLFDFVFYFSMLWIAGSELLNWMDIFGFQNSHKIGLSILAGVYALILIVIGISRRKKHLRVGAIALFALTLIKLFFYDIAELDTISKTIVFVSLGILMLIVSFLYNKYKHSIAEIS